jgi:hypothetical protein
LAVSVLPSCAVPEIVGGAVFVGLTCCAAVPLSANPATAARTSNALPATTAIHRFLMRLTIEPPYRLRHVSPTRESRKNAGRSDFTGRLQGVGAASAAAQLRGARPSLHALGLACVFGGGS